MARAAVGLSRPGAVLQQGRDGHIRWSLFRAGLCRTADSRTVSLVAAERNAQRAGYGRDHSRPIDHGCSVRGIHGCLSPPRTAESCRSRNLGSAITTWVTFVPCFYWIFLGAPYIERLRGNKQLTAALSTITAAVVGVVLNLAVWFAVHTLFGKVDTVNVGPGQLLKLTVPVWSTIDWGAVLIATLAMLLTFRWKRGMVTTLVACVVVGMAWWASTR